MAFVLLIHETIGQRAERGPVEGEAIFARMVAWAHDLKARGQLTVFESLAGAEVAARVQVSAGKPQVLDGPFAEAKEMVGGFFLLTCDTRQQAIEIAATCPAAAWATVEVRETGPCFT